MVGSGTTLIEAKLLNRNGIGYDINQNAVEITKDRLNFKVENNSCQNVSLVMYETLTKYKTIL